MTLLVAVAGSAALLLVPGCGGGGGDEVSCQSDLDCLIVCDCPGAADGASSYPCRWGTCGAEHAERADCSQDCFRPPPGGDDDDDSASPGDDDSAPSADDDDSGG